MQSLRYLPNNRTLSTGTSIYQFDGEDPLYPASNLRVRDRFVVWRAPAGSLGMIYYTGFAAVSVDTFAVLGIGRAVNNPFPTQFTVYASTNAPSPTPSYEANMTAVAVISANSVRDGFAILPAPVSGRYWRFVANGNSAGFSVGKFALGTAVSLFPVSAGSTEDIIRPRVRNPLVNGATAMTEVGLPHRRYMFVSRPLDAADAGKVRSLGSTMQLPLTVFLPDGFSAAEVDLADDTVTLESVFGAEDLYNATVALESLP